MKKLLLAIAMIAGMANAEIYKYVDPATGAVEYVNQPKKGATPLSSADLDALADNGGRAKAAALKKKSREQARVNSEKSAREQLSKLFPKDCATHERCEIVPGMPVSVVVKAFTLTPAGFTHNAQGKTERFKRGGCVISSMNDRVVSVDC